MLNWPATSTSLCEGLHYWSFLRKYIKMFVSTLHTLKSQECAAEVRWSMAWFACAWQSACLRWKKRKIS